jgi:PPOX class probable F420-dependent enzyme
MELSDALAFAAANRHAVLATQKRDGRPQLSNVTHSVGADGIVRISITAGRAKYANLIRDPRASLHVARDDFWAYVVLEGDAEVTPVATDTGDATVDELVEYRRVMVDDRRVVVRLRPTRAYGMLGN